MTEPTHFLPDTRSQAVAYHARGWPPLELPTGAKGPPPEGRTGYAGIDLTAAEVAAGAWTGNLGLRMPPDVIGLDIDAYRGGLITFNELVARLGKLPNTWISHSGRNDGSGIRFYRVPVGMSWVAGLAGMDIIQRSHRYAAAYPSTHPDGRQYGLWDQAEGGPTTMLPEVDDLPDLPWPWIKELSRASAGDVLTHSQAVDQPAVVDFVTQHNRADAPSYITGSILAHFHERHRQNYSRHDTMQHCLTWAMEHVRAGVAAAQPTINQLAMAWQEAVADNPRRAELSSTRRVTEFQAMLRHAIGKANAKTQAQLDGYHDAAAGIPIGDPGRLSSDAQPEPEPEPSIFIDWAVFAQRDSQPRRWLVEQFWPWGRAMALWAAAKEGKSELALWCAAKLALGRHPWNNDPMEPLDVAYFDYEMTPDDLEERLDAFDFDLTQLGRLHYALSPPLYPLDTEAGGKELVRWVTSVGAQGVVVDTFGRSVGGDENDADTVRNFVRHTGHRLKQLGIGYIRTDHAGKDRTKGQRGTSAKRDDVDVIWAQKRSHTGVLLDCSGSSRLDWVGPILNLDRVQTAGVISYSSPIRLGWPDGTLEKAAQLDGAGVSLDAGRPAAVKALKAAGLKPGRIEVLAAALRYRKLPSPTRPGAVPERLSDGPPDLFSDS